MHLMQHDLHLMEVIISFKVKMTKRMSTAKRTIKNGRIDIEEACIRQDPQILNKVACTPFVTFFTIRNLQCHHDVLFANPSVIMADRLRPIKICSKIGLVE